MGSQGNTTSQEDTWMNLGLLRMSKTVCLRIRTGREDRKGQLRDGECCSRMYSLIWSNGKGPVQEEQLTQDDVRKEGKGRIRILIGKILVTRKHDELGRHMDEPGIAQDE